MLGGRASEGVEERRVVPSMVTMEKLSRVWWAAATASQGVHFRRFVLPILHQRTMVPLAGVFTLFGLGVHGGFAGLSGGEGELPVAAVGGDGAEGEDVHEVGGRKELEELGFGVGAGDVEGGGRGWWWGRGRGRGIA